MKSRKGAEDMIAVVILFFLSVTLAFVMYMLLAGHTSNIERTASAEIEYQVGEVEKRSAVTATINDHMWRAPSVENDYHGLKAYKVLSRYFSTTGDTLYIEGEEIPMEAARSDLKNYVSYKMREYYGAGSRRADYYLKIFPKEQGEGQPEPILVERKKRYPDAEWRPTSYPLALSGGQKAYFVLWTRKSSGQKQYGPRGVRAP